MRLSRQSSLGVQPSFTVLPAVSTTSLSTGGTSLGVPCPFSARGGESPRPDPVARWAPRFCRGFRRQVPPCRLRCRSQVFPTPARTWHPTVPNVRLFAPLRRFWTPKLHCSETRRQELPVEAGFSARPFTRPTRAYPCGHSQTGVVAPGLYLRLHANFGSDPLTPCSPPRRFWQTGKINAQYPLSGPLISARDRRTHLSLPSGGFRPLGIKRSRSVRDYGACPDD
jgi:hypothetical protein